MVSIHAFENAEKSEYLCFTDFFIKRQSQKNFKEPPNENLLSKI
jgi:hypothetical protein